MFPNPSTAPSWILSVLATFEQPTINKEIREVISNIAGGSTSKTKKPTKKEIAKTIETIEQEMREAARNLDFERAMELRDILFEMKSN